MKINIQDIDYDILKTFKSVKTDEIHWISKVFTHDNESILISYRHKESYFGVLIVRIDEYLSRKRSLLLKEILK